MIATVLALPGLWAGLAFAAACLAGSLWLRPAARLQPRRSNAHGRHRPDMA